MNVFPDPEKAFKVSGNSRKTETRFTALRTAANQKGVIASNQLTNDESDNSPPITGPTTKPKPKAAPTRAKFFTLSSGLLMSAVAACAIAMSPPVAPMIIRATNRRGILRSEIPRTNMRYESPIPASENNRSVFLPGIGDLTNNRGGDELRYRIGTNQESKDNISFIDS